jgi:hypothetical protein
MTSKLGALGTQLPSKRVLAVGLVAVMLVLAGCGGNGSSDNGTEAAAGEGTTEMVTSAMEEETSMMEEETSAMEEETSMMEEETSAMEEETSMMGNETSMMGNATTEASNGSSDDGLLGGIFSGFFGGDESQAAVENVTIYPNGSVFYQNGTEAGSVSVMGNDSTTLENVSVYPNGSVLDNNGTAVGNVTSASGNLSNESLTTQMGNMTNGTTTAA